MAGSVCKYRHNEVADLAWAIGSCPLMAGEVADIYHLPDEDWFRKQLEKSNSLLEMLDADPEPLMSFLQLHPQKLLGKRFENMIEFWLRNNDEMEYLFSNVQLKTGSATTGEIDFLCREKSTGDCIHIEVACKYYLAAANSKVWNNWIGPNGTDNLHSKLKKLEKQFLILGKESGLKFLERNSLEQPKRMLFMKGYFFQHYSLIGKHCSPKFAHPHHHGGWYMHLREIDNLSGNVQQWILPPRDFWIGRYCRPSGNSEIFTGVELIPEVNEVLVKKGKAPLLIQVESRDGFDVEISRGFVVKDEWPQLAC